jgi:diguanylate cyclase (GGDEF)-like protein/PAS domain S-box-containing protein
MRYSYPRSKSISRSIDAKNLTEGYLQSLGKKFDALTNEFESLYEFVPFGCHSLDIEGTYLSLNAKELEWLGYAREEVVGKMKFIEFLTPESQENYRRFFPEHSSRSGYIGDLELVLIGKDGKLRHATLYSYILLDLNGNFSRYRSFLYDQTELKKLKIAAAVFQAQEGMIIADANGIITSVNASFASITGYTEAEVIGKNPHILSSGRHDKKFYADMWNTIKRLGYWKGEIWNKRKNGEIYPELLCITAVKDSEGVLQNYVATLTDVTMSRNVADEIQHLAYYDTLTRLPNRRLLMDRLPLAMASSSRTGKQGALLFLDLDNFKTLNDTLGHSSGDSLLEQTALRLETCVREGDTVARLGGDEFVVMLENLSERPLEAAKQTESVGKKILAALEQPFQINSFDYRNTTSIGITLFSAHQISIDELLKQADIAMYQAKKSGRNRMCFFDPKMQASINARAKLVDELHAAIIAGQFRLYYQVQVDGSGTAVGAEALIRWQHPQLGITLPAYFIAMAEETDLIVQIGSWVLDVACAQLKAWEQTESTQKLTLSVNVSSKQFHQADFVSQVRSAVIRHSINPSLLKLEPTESVLLENIEDAVATMNALKEIGIRFALDDFGTGFSSLQYLKKLPLNQLKIDQSFVKDLATDGSDQAIVRTIIAMAHSLNLEVIAEGVETEEQRFLLQSNGCNHFQGYLFGKPMPIEELEKHILGART